MPQPLSFARILEQHLNSEELNSSVSLPKEEDQALWVQVLPYIKSQNVKVSRPFPYKNMKHTPRSAQTPEQKHNHAAPPAPKATKATPPPEPPKPKLVLKVSTLNSLQTLALELLVREGWIPRQETYELTEWKKAHRKAAKALHPDTNPNNNTQFTEIHETFKNLKPLFKTR